LLRSPSRKKTRTKLGGLENDANSSTTSSDKKLPNWFTCNTIRRILESRSKCHCWCCKDTGIRYNYDIEVLAEEIKSTQKSIAHCKEDTNKILSKVERLEKYFQ